MKNAQGKTRRAGFELEFAGLDMADAARIVAEAVHGEVLADTAAECRVIHPVLGHFNIELDWSFAKNMARRLEEQGKGEDRVIALMTDLARQVVPLEVVCPPIPFDQFHVLNTMIESLRRAGALGTSDSFVYAFGVHINTELPDLQASTLVAYLQAYCVAQNWLLKAHNVDPVRRLMPYIDPYPKSYIQKVLKYTEHTALADIIDDYLLENSTRNRGMDLLPLFKHLNEEKVLAAVKDERVNARPTFHYRLPNSEIDKPLWQLSESWNIWCVVEHLAANPVILKSICEQWLVHHDKLINLKEETWHQELEQIHANLLLA